MQLPCILKKILLSFIIIILTLPCFAEIAILPYKINSPSKYFPVSTGKEYSRLLFIAANLKKEIPLTSPKNLEVDLERMRIDPQGTVTEDHINFLAEQLKIEYVIMGKLSKTRRGYVSETLLYSIGDRRVILRIKNNVGDLFKLCELDTLNILESFSNKVTRKSSSALDVAVLLDTSYSTYYDLPDIKKGIAKLASLVIDRNRINARFFIVPFSSDVTFDKAFFSANSITGLKKGLSKLKAYGRGSPGNFIKSLKYSLNNLNWRSKAKKTILLLSNTNLNNARFIERYGAIARKKMITINTISLGKLTNYESGPIIRLSTMSMGKHYNVAYHQKFFDADGEAVNIYMQNGRIFKTISYHKQWHSGIFETIEHKNEYAKPKDVFEELFYDSKKVPATPYNLEKQYMKISTDRIINKRKLKSNIDFLIERAVSEKIEINTNANIGRVLLTDGEISVWADIDDPGTLAFFEKKERIKEYFYAGLMISSSDSSIYGLRFRPVITGLFAGELPKKLIVKLRDLIKKRNYYLNNGLFFPPAWFVKVKVGKLNKFSSSKDLRD